MYGILFKIYVYFIYVQYKYTLLNGKKSNMFR